MANRPIVSKEVHLFKKGRQMDLDHIYHIQGLAGGDWWDWVWLDGSVGEAPAERRAGERLSERVEITRDIEITITVR